MKIGLETTTYALPERVLTNDELHAQNPGWDIERLRIRTGVESRHVASEGETAFDLGLAACRSLDREGRLMPETIDGLIVCTQTPDYPLPGNSSLIHEALRLRTDIFALDVNSACSGFIHCLGVAAGLIRGGSASRILIVTGDTYSRLIHPQDRSSRVLFGDGVAATIVGTEAERFTLIDMSFGLSGKEYRRFIVPAGGSRLPRSAETAAVHHDRSGNARTAEHIAMDGLGVLSFFNTVVPNAVTEMLTKNSLSVADVACFVFHQASRVVLENVAKSMKLAPSQALINMADTGNLVSASIPAAIARGMQDGHFKPGDLVVLCGFGVGLSWGTALLRA